MPDALAYAAQATGSALRLGWYFGLNRLVAWQTPTVKAASESASEPSRKPMPSLRDLIADIGALMLRDAKNVREGHYPTSERKPEAFADEIARVRELLEDLPVSTELRANRNAKEASGLEVANGLPAYYAQNFHFQTGGYLTEASARLYDMQVETLFLGAAELMRRMALLPIAQAMRGRDQRALRLLDVACGTGRFLREARLAFPALNLSGLDLSRAYLDEAAAHLTGLRQVALIEGNAEAIPLASESQDFVTTIFLFHELPPDVRRQVTAEMARVLKPGGLLVFIDSLQLGDRPAYDGLLEAFPRRFHEPYYRGYLIDDLDQMFAAAGLSGVSSEKAYLSKVMVRRKA